MESRNNEMLHWIIIIDSEKWTNGWMNSININCLSF